MPTQLETIQYHQAKKALAEAEAAKEKLRAETAILDEKKTNLQTQYNQTVKKVQEIESSLPVIASRIEQAWSATVPEMISLLQQRDAMQAIKKACLTHLELLNGEIQVCIRQANDLMQKIHNIGFYVIPPLRKEIAEHQRLAAADEFNAPM